MHVSERRGLLVVGSLGLLCVCMVPLMVRSGFNASDDGFILSQSQRILAGEIPHADFVSPRPVGSPLLHVIDVVLPTPLLVTSRAIVLAEILATAALSVRLVTGRRLRGWGVWETSLSASAALVSLHVFPLMAWHTIDGLLISCAALVLVENAMREARMWSLRIGVLLLGFVPLIKQSFAPVPVLGAIAMLWYWRQYREHPERVEAGSLPQGFTFNRVVKNSLVVVLPGFLYVLWVAAGSALGRAKHQLLAASVDPLAGIHLDHDTSQAALLAYVLLSLVGIGALVRGRNRLATALDVIGRCGLVVLAGWALLKIVPEGDLALGGTWATQLWWLAVGSTVVASVVERSLQFNSFAIICLGWSATLSWGYAFANLFAGSLGIVVIVNIARILPNAIKVSLTSMQAVASVASVVLLGYFTILSLSDRQGFVYRDVPEAKQSVDLGSLVDEGRWVTTNPAMGSFISEVGACLDRYPARQLAVLPASAVVPTLFGRRNPLPVDWWYPPETGTDDGGLVDMSKDAMSKGDVLVLFSTVMVEGSSGMSTVPAANAESVPRDYAGSRALEVFQALDGERVTCGPYVGKYKAAQA